MDGIANVAKQQQSQISTADMQGKVQREPHIQQSSQTTTKQTDFVKELQDSTLNDTKTMDSKKDVENLVQQLNDALAPLKTDIKFGVDTNDIFYVAAIDTKTERTIRRFPAEQAQNFLPKMQEVSGILFDSKG